ncbi:acetylornithine deacetylase [Falsiphaeobacter marinintestinus]|uniref:acetylornithine deacetylase n=1 Tax=Falsiphaeobacter marinintestinus TaxID=1492905 RepID=UPI0011B6099A|nr:acetylornithine deacetylase [Phaeobacter marinintestinus]
MTRTLDILERLIAFPTVSADSNLALIDYVQDVLVKVGFDVTRIPSPCRQKAGLFARIGPAIQGGVCLSAHTDVVPVGHQTWTVPPFKLTRKDGRVHGRGTTDMKGFLASVLAMAERSGAADLSEPLSLVISYDEEIGCVGIREMMPDIRGLIGKPCAVIVGEPTSMQVAIGHKGKAALRATCHGESGHSAQAPNFVNAIHVAADFVQGLRKVQTDLANGAQDKAYAISYSTVHVGKIRGGEALNIVPDQSVVDFEIRHLALTPVDEIRAMIDAAARRVEAGFKTSAAKIVIEEVNRYPGLDTPREADIVSWANHMAGETGITKVAFGTEAGVFDELGLPVVVMGPGDMTRDGHKPDEGLDLSDLTACDAMLDRVLSDL